MTGAQAGSGARATEMTMMAPLRTFFLALLIATGLVGSFSAGVLADRVWFRPEPLAVPDRLGSLTTDTPPTGRANLETFDEVWKMIQEQYYRGPVDQEKLLYAAIKGLVGALEDENSRFLTPEENEPTRSQMEGHFDGIGVWISTEENVLRVIAPMDGSPAQRAGIQAGDVIIGIDGRDVTGLKPDESLPLVRGQAGTRVRLTIRRPGQPTPLEIEVERARIEVDAVTYQVLDGNIGYIRATVFGDKTTPQLDAALKDLQAKNVRGIVLDLRNNGGGWVSSAREMLGRFLPDGVALVERSRGGERVDTVLTSAEVRAYEVPLVVLVNGGSASASEIVAGALKDRGRATIIGERTYGKGSIQQVRDFGDNSSLRLTTAVWLTPDKHTIEKDGITPDLIIGPAGEPADEILRNSQLRPRLPRALGPANPDGRTGPPDHQLERARQFLLTGE
jgi:carboxyl-terminal processing protease